ncbi:MAG: hypothetical protein HQK88_11760 [Nitrospirae bacterium]|nr:hypothetical protein [Nitrospirota bacterium]MBF0535594.1 hypothetical protein [Nitrospirota bacterium]MBF0617477.1 hypothetical protein [Nitrospirota bacterium]
MTKGKRNDKGKKDWIPQQVRDDREVVRDDREVVRDDKGGASVIPVLFLSFLRRQESMSFNTSMK